MPALGRLAESLMRDGLVVLAVNAGEDSDAVEAFGQRHGISFPILLDQDLQTYTRWPVLGLPTTFLVDRRGCLARKAVGVLDWESPEVIDALRTAMATTDPPCT